MTLDFHFTVVATLHHHGQLVPAATTLPQPLANVSRLLQPGSCTRPARGCSRCAQPVHVSRTPRRRPKTHIQLYK